MSASRELARSVTPPSSSSARPSASRRSFSRGSASVSEASVGADSRAARPQAARRGPVSIMGSIRSSSVPSSTLPGRRQRPRTGRTSGTDSKGGGPAIANASRASAVNAMLEQINERSVSGSAPSARSRPIGVRVSRARRARSPPHSTLRPPIRPASTGRLMLSRSYASREPWTCVLVLHAFAALRLFPRRQRLALASHARLLVVLTLLELGQEPGLLALFLEALEGALEGLVGLDDDLGHTLPPSGTDRT